MKLLLDTNTIIYAHKNLGQVRKHWSETPFDDVALCSVNIFELEYGLAKSSRPHDLSQFITRLSERHPILNFDSKAAVRAGQVRAHLANLGLPIGPFDLMIAGIALANGLTIVTRNSREFSRVPQLGLQNWFE